MPGPWSKGLGPEPGARGYRLQGMQGRYAQVLKTSQRGLRLLRAAEAGGRNGKGLSKLAPTQLAKQMKLPEN